MDLTRLKELIATYASILGILYVGYTAYDYYFNFLKESQSPLNMKAKEIEGIKMQVAAVNKKLLAAKEFAKGFEAKRNEVKESANLLSSMKETLSENLDVPDFMKVTVTEAKKVGLTVLGLRPTARVEKEFYVEQPFDLQFRGVFVQLLVFLERMAGAQRIVRVDSFDLRPVGSSSARYVELEGTLQIKTYQYRGSDADKRVKKEGP